MGLFRFLMLRISSQVWLIFLTRTCIRDTGLAKPYLYLYTTRSTNKGKYNASSTPSSSEVRPSTPSFVGQRTIQHWRVCPFVRYRVPFHAAYEIKSFRFISWLPSSFHLLPVHPLSLPCRPASSSVSPSLYVVQFQSRHPSVHFQHTLLLCHDFFPRSSFQWLLCPFDPSQK